MKKIIMALALVMMVMPILVLGQEGDAQRVYRVLHTNLRELAKSYQERLKREDVLCIEAPRILQLDATPMLGQDSKDWLYQKHDADRIIQKLKTELEHERFRIEQELYMQSISLQLQIRTMIKEFNNRIFIERLFPEIYCPGYFRELAEFPFLYFPN
jgi:hypothetical protein